MAQARSNGGRASVAMVAQNMPSHVVFLAMRSNTPQYTLFLDKFVRQVVGARKFDKLSCEMLISEFVKNGCEAYGLLVYENQEDRWREMMEQDTNKSSKPAKYTDGGKAQEKSGRSRRAKGWSNAGLRRFNELFGMVFEDRKKPHAVQFEREYRDHRLRLREERLGERAGKKQTQHYEGDNDMVLGVSHEMGDEVVVCHDPCRVDQQNTDGTGSQEDNQEHGGHSQNY